MAASPQKGALGPLLPHSKPNDRGGRENPGNTFP